MFLETNLRYYFAFGPSTITSFVTSKTDMYIFFLNNVRLLLFFLLLQELQKYLDDAVEGVIYFSFGSNIKSSNLDAVKRSIIRNTLAMLPYKILWKFEHENMPEKPENVMISKWLPQQDILGHPNIKLFITQGGLQSLEEAILNKVPLLAIPFMFDQYANAKRITKLGIGLDLQYNKLSSSEFKAAILEVVQNSK